MANYYAASRTNYFRVTDEERYKELFERLVSEDNVDDFTVVTDGVIYHGFGSYGSIDFEIGEEEHSIDEFLRLLQKILPEDEAFMLFETGHEKLRYVVGYCYLVTQKEIRCMDLDEWAKSQAREILGNEFATKTTY